MADGRRSSILKPPKQRAPLQEVNSLNIHHEDFTSTTITQNIMRRVSFAGTSTVKEFDTQAESVLVCHTPAYEESFAASDSSVPSDHSSRFSSRSTISIEDQSTHTPASSEGIDEIVNTEDELFVDFGISKPSQPAAKPPTRRTRFSIGITSDDESPKVQEKALSAIPSSLFFGKDKPKPKKSAISSPQLLKIDPFSLRPKPVSTSPKPQLKRKSLLPVAQPSSKSKSPAPRFASSPNDSTSSEMDLTEAIPSNIFVVTPSPSSVTTEKTPESARSAKFTSVGSPDLNNKTTHDDRMEFTRVMPTKVLDKGEYRTSVSGDGGLHCTFRNSVLMEFPQPVTGVAIRNEQNVVTEANRSVTCTTNSVIMGLLRSDNERISHPATMTRSEDVGATEMVYAGRCSESWIQPSNVTGVVTDNVPVARFNTTVRDLEGMELTEVVSSSSGLENGNPGDAPNVTVCEPDGMELTRVIPGLPVLEDEEQCRGPPYNQALNDTAGMELTEAMPSTPFLREIDSAATASDTKLNNTLNDSVGMDLTEAIPYVPQLHTPSFSKSFCAEQLSKTLSDSVGMEFTKVMPTMPQLQTPGHSKESQAEPFNKTLNDSVGMDFTRVIPIMCQLQTPSLSKSSQVQPVNKTLNDTIGMDFTKVIPAVPQLQTPGLSKSSKAESLSKTLNDTVGMDFTKVIPTVPQLQNSSLCKSSEVQPVNKTLNDTIGMDFTKAIPTVPQLQTPGLSKSSKAEPLSKTLNDTVGMDFTKVIPTVPQLQNSSLCKSSQVQPFNKTLNDTVGMDLTIAIPSASRLHIPGKSFRVEPVNETRRDSVGMELTKAIPTLALELSSKDICSSNEPVVDQRTPCHSVGMQISQTVSAKQFDNIPCGVHDSRTPALDYESALLDTVGMVFTDVGTAPVSLDSSKGNKTNNFPSLEEDSSSKSVIIDHSSADSKKILMVSKTSVAVSTIDTSTKGTKNTTLTRLTEPSCGIRTASTSLNVQLVTELSDIEGSVSRADSIRTTNQTQETKEANLSRTSNFLSQTSVRETLQTRLPEGDLASSSESVRLTTASSLETPPQVSHVSHLQPTPIDVQLSRKRSINEVDDTEPHDIVPQIRRSLTNSAPISPSEIMIPSSRSPSPVDHDCSTRFPGLSQSFSSNRSLKTSEAVPPPVEEASSVTDDHLTQDHYHTTSAKTVLDITKGPGWVTEEASTVYPPSNLVEAVSSSAILPVPVARSVRVESDGFSSSLTSEVSRKFSSPDEGNFTDVSVMRKSMCPDRSLLETDHLFYKSTMDPSIPMLDSVSMLEISDLGGEHDGSSVARLYATLREAENNVSLFQQEPEGNASSIEESTNDCREGAIRETNMSVGEEVKRNDISEEHESCRNKADEGEEPERNKVEERRAFREDLEKIASRTRVDKAMESSVPGSPSKSILPSESPCLIEPNRKSLFDGSSTDITADSRVMTDSRTAEEIIRTHWVEYRKRERCNWTWQKSSGGKWVFWYLDDSVELQIKVEELSRSQLLTGYGGRFISLLDDSDDGLWHIGGRLLFQILSSEKWATRLQKTNDVLSLLEDVNRVANDIEKFKTTLAYLRITKNIDITNDWIRFDILSRKSSKIWFKVKVDCRDVLNLQPSHVSIQNILGETRQTDIQNLVTCVKKGPYILKHYYAIVEEYLETIERIQ